VPLYEYRCAGGHATDVFHPVGAELEVHCETCGQSAQRVLTPPMVHTQFYFSSSVIAPRKPREREMGKPDRNDDES